MMFFEQKSGIKTQLWKLLTCANMMLLIVNVPLTVMVIMDARHFHWWDQRFFSEDFSIILYWFHGQKNSSPVFTCRTSTNNLTSFPSSYGSNRRINSKNVGRIFLFSGGWLVTSDLNLIFVWFLHRNIGALAAVLKISISWCWSCWWNCGRDDLH